MKISHFTTLLVTIVGIAAATPLRGGFDRHLEMDEGDFRFLEIDYEAKDDPDDSNCFFYFRVEGHDEEHINLKYKIDEQDDKVICREKGKEAESNEEYGVTLPVKADIDIIQWTDKDGNDVKTTSAYVAWFVGGDGKKKIKVTIFKDDSDPGGDPPECKNEEDNVFNDDCEYSTKEWEIKRSDGGSTDTYTVFCTDSKGNNPVHYWFGTNDKSCDDDKICSCETGDYRVSCDVHIAEETGDCPKGRVRIVAHAICCDDD